MVSVVVNATNGVGLFAQAVLERAMTTNFRKNSGGRVQDTIVENIKATVEITKADHQPEGWRMVRLVAAVAAQPNMDPAMPAKLNTRGNSKGCFLPSPTYESVQAIVHFAALLLAIPPIRAVEVPLLVQVLLARHR